MPIRMVDDSQDPLENSGGEQGGDSGVGGGGGLFGLIPLLFMLFRGPKSLLWLLVIGIGGYFIFSRGRNMQFKVQGEISGVVACIVKIDKK